MPMSLTNGLLYVRQIINDVASTAYTDAELTKIINDQYHQLSQDSGRLVHYHAGAGGDGVTIGANSLNFDVPAGSGTTVFAEITDVRLWVTSDSNPQVPMEKRTLREVWLKQAQETTAAAAPKIWAAERLAGSTPNGRWRVWIHPKVNAAQEFIAIGRAEVTELTAALIPELSEARSYTLWKRAAIMAAIPMGWPIEKIQALIAQLPQEEQKQFEVALRAHRPFHGENVSG